MEFNKIRFKIAATKHILIHSQNFKFCTAAIYLRSMNLIPFALPAAEGLYWKKLFY